MYPLLRQLLFLLPTEISHDVSLGGLSAFEKMRLLKITMPAEVSDPVELMGIEFPNRIGLAAGLDKNGDYINALGCCGFGFLEIGTVTPRPQPGNPLPRLFRLPSERAIINRMGFNNKGVEYLIGRAGERRWDGVLGINIGKNFDTPVGNAVDDYLLCLERVYGHADYVTVNISSPNTPGLRDLQHSTQLRRLLGQLKSRQRELADEHDKNVPLLVKIAPDIDSENLVEMAEVFMESQIDGVIATNTTIDHSSVEDLQYGAESGGLSGAPLTQRSTEVIAALSESFQGRLPIIGVGGIMNAEDAAAKIEAGASLVQIYSGFIYRGPKLIKESADALAKLS